MSRYDWLLFLHVASAFAVAAALVVLTGSLLAARRRERPSEIALAFGLTRANVILFDVAGTAILVFGVLLVLDLDAYEITEAWILATLALWLVTALAGARAARTYRQAGTVARRLAAEGDVPTGELTGLVRDRRAAVLHAVSAAALLAALVLMIYKPGAP